MAFDPNQFRDLYPFDSHFFNHRGFRYHYVDEGEGPPVVMVHGNPTWSFYYRNLIKALRPTHRAIAIDHLGCGLSDKPSADQYSFRLSDRIDDLEFLIESLDLKEPLTLVVHDWGGAIGMGYAVRHPDRIARLVIMNTAAFGLPPGKSFPWQLALARSPLIGGWMIPGLNAFARGATFMACEKPMDPKVKRGFLAPYDSWQSRLATYKFVEDIPLGRGEPSFEILQEITAGVKQFGNTPTLVCWGLCDFVFDISFLNQWREELPQAEVHEFGDAGHYVLEDAGEQIIPLVTQFLNGPALVSEPASTSTSG